jgi:hypothetical protein
MRCGVAAAALQLLVFAALPLDASKHVTPAQLGKLQKGEKHALRATAGVEAMKASQAVTDIALVGSGHTDCMTAARLCHLSTRSRTCSDPAASCHLQAVTSGKTFQDESFTERASTTRFSEHVGPLRGGYSHPEINDAMLLSSRTDMAMGALRAAGPQRGVDETIQGQTAAGVRPGGQSVALTKLMNEMPQKEATEDEGVLVPVLKQEAVHARVRVLCGIL